MISIIRAYCDTPCTKFIDPTQTLPITEFTKEQKFFQVLIILFQKNKNHLLKLSQKDDITLSQRYQIHENIRMMRFAIPFLVYPASGFVLTGTFSIVIQQILPELPFSEINLFYFTVTLH